MANKHYPQALTSVLSQFCFCALSPINRGFRTINLAADPESLAAGMRVQSVRAIFEEVGVRERV